MGEDQDTGFELVRISQKRISGAFYSKRIRRLNLTTIRGDIETVARESVERVDFEIDLFRGLLVIVDPKLERRRFVSHLISCARFRVTLEPFYKDVSDFIKILTTSQCEFEVLRVLLCDVVISKGIQARVAASGTLKSEALTGKIGSLQGRIARFDVKLEVDGKNHNGEELRIYSEGRIEFPKVEDKRDIMQSYARLKIL